MLESVRTIKQSTPVAAVSILTKFVKIDSEVALLGHRPWRPIRPIATIGYPPVAVFVKHAG